MSQPLDSLRGPLAGPPLTADQHLARLDRIRQAMLDRGYEALLVASMREHAVRYLGFYDPDLPSRPYGLPNMVVALLPASGEPLLLFGGLPFLEHRVRQASLIEDVVAVQGPVDAPIDRAIAELRRRGLHLGTVALAGRELDWALEQRILATLPDCRVLHAADWLDQLRIRKDERELELMQEAQRLADIGLATAIASAAPGVSDLELYAAAEQAMRLAGADENSFALIGQAGTDEVELCEALDGRRYERDAIVVYEALPYHRCYNAELMGTIALGDVRPDQQRLAELCAETLRQLGAMLAPGASTRQLQRHAEERFREAGHPQGCTHTVGHFLGLDNYEGPPLGSDQVLEPGMVITLHPNLVEPCGPKAISHATWQITDDGARRISGLPIQALFRPEEGEGLLRGVEGACL